MNKTLNDHEYFITLLIRYSIYVNNEICREVKLARGLHFLYTGVFLKYSINHERARAITECYDEDRPSGGSVLYVS